MARKPSVQASDFERAPFIRAKYHRSSLFRPGKDLEWEAESLQELEVQMADSIAEVVSGAINEDKHTDPNDLHPASLIMSPVGVFPEHPFAAWVTAGALFEVEVEVNVSIRPREVRKAQR